MKVYHRLAAGAALGAIAMTSAMPADAKPKKHSAARKHAEDPRDAKIRSLEAKLDALTQRIDAQEAAQQATAQQAQSAQAAAADCANAGDDGTEPIAGRPGAGHPGCKKRCLR